MFSTHITFTFDRKQHYQTLCGGITSLFVITMLIIYLIAMLTEPLQISQFNTSISSYIDNSSEQSKIRIDGSNLHFDSSVNVKKSVIENNIYQNTTRIYPQLNGFNIGAKFSFSTYDPTKMYIDFVALIKNQSQMGYYEKIGARACTEDDFPSSLSSDLVFLNVSSFYCPMQEDIDMYSNQYGDQFKLIEIRAVICTNTTTNSSCESIEDIYNDYYTDNLLLLYSEASYDYNDNGNIVKYRLNSDTHLPVDYSQMTVKNYRISPSIVQTVNGTNHTFIKAREVNSITEIMNTVYPAIIQFEVDNHYDYYEQYTSYDPVVGSINSNNTRHNVGDQKLMSNTYFILFVMSQLGGLYVALTLILGWFVNFINYRSFMIDMLNITHKESLVRKLENQFNQVMGKGSQRGDLARKNNANQAQNLNLYNVDDINMPRNHRTPQIFKKRDSSGRQLQAGYNQVQKDDSMEVPQVNNISEHYNSQFGNRFEEILSTERYQR